MEILGLALLLTISWVAYSSFKRGRGPMRPYLKIDGRLREVVHRKRIGSSVVCTVKPLEKGSSRPRVIVPAEGGDIVWLPKR